MSANVLERTWSDFLREPKTVTEEVEHADIVLRRRDGENLYLVTEQRQAAVQATFAIVSRMLASIASDASMRRKLAIQPTMPWLTFLPIEDRSQFAQEFIDTAVASAELGTLQPLSMLIAEWRNTALIHADPVLAAALGRSHPGTNDAVQRPAAETG